MASTIPQLTERTPKTVRSPISARIAALPARLDEEPANRWLLRRMPAALRRPVRNGSHRRAAPVHVPLRGGPGVGTVAARDADGPPGAAA
ncbi:hypothetical protein ACTVZO_38390 [Streptomyces sp. IBSNAI002]|uniref:hypothetical protein n=1 Tax=Streptomyces sp. IBSNAI002 TaxID=3457500 RepID=UPI003FD64360